MLLIWMYVAFFAMFIFFLLDQKLSGPAKGTAQWLTSVGNEVGQVLMSVLTANEGAGC